MSAPTASARQTRTTVTRDVKDRQCSASEPGRRNAAPTDRRRQVLHALLHGSFNPRRRGRGAPMSAQSAPWIGINPQWLAIAMLIVMFSGY